MNRLDRLFQTRKNICSVFYTAGFPLLNSTVETGETLSNEGVDLLEIGMPFSDPLADGPVIQRASAIALENGMNIDLLLDQVELLRAKTQVPIVLMGYFNPVYRYGVGKFLSRCKEVGIDGLIIPDLYPEVYLREYQPLFEKIDIPLIFLVTTRTKRERVQLIESLSKSFIYVVSQSSVTGKSQVFNSMQEDDFKAFDAKNIVVPTLLGFGIHNRANFETACKYFSGGIIGTAFIRHLEVNKSAGGFIQTLRKRKGNLN